MLLDPLDGTALFAAGDPRFAMTVALCDGREATAAWLLYPALGRAVEAGPGGVTVDGAPARPARAGARRHRLRFVRPPCPPLPGWSDEDPTSGEYLRMAAGQTAAYLCSHTTPWDTAPGVAVVRAMGGAAGRCDGAPWRPADEAGLLLFTAAPEDWAPLVARHRLDRCVARSPLEAR